MILHVVGNGDAVFFDVTMLMPNIAVRLRQQRHFDVVLPILQAKHLNAARVNGNTSLDVTVPLFGSEHDSVARFR